MRSLTNSVCRKATLLAGGASKVVKHEWRRTLRYIYVGWISRHTNSCSHLKTSMSESTLNEVMKYELVNRQYMTTSRRVIWLSCLGKFVWYILGRIGYKFYSIWMIVFPEFDLCGRETLFPRIDSEVSVYVTLMLMTELLGHIQMPSKLFGTSRISGLRWFYLISAKNMQRSLENSAVWLYLPD